MFDGLILCWCICSSIRSQILPATSGEGARAMFCEPTTSAESCASRVHLHLPTGWSCLVSHTFPNRCSGVRSLPWQGTSKDGALGARWGALYFACRGPSVFMGSSPEWFHFMGSSSQELSCTTVWGAFPQAGQLWHGRHSHGRASALKEKAFIHRPGCLCLLLQLPAGCSMRTHDLECCHWGGGGICSFHCSQGSSPPTFRCMAAWISQTSYCAL